MKNDRGATLVWLVFIVALFLLLGSALLVLAQTDMSISRNLWAAAQARYAAEAAIELAVSTLGPVFPQLDGEGWGYTHSREPEFTVQAFRKDERTLTLKAEGRAGGVTHTVEVLAVWRPLGRHGLRGREVTLKDVTVHGHVACEEITFTGGDNWIFGNLHARYLYGGHEQVTGHKCREALPYRAGVDFLQLAERAQREGWEIVAGVEIYPVEVLPPAPVFVYGDAEVFLQETAKGVLVALGNVYLNGWFPGSKVVVLAAGNIVLPDSGGLWNGSLFLYSGRKITREGRQLLQLHGSLAAAELVLEGLEIVYDDEAIFAVLSCLPETLFALQPSFDLEWQDVKPRR